MGVKGWGRGGDGVEGGGGGEWEPSASPPDNDVCSLALPCNPITVPMHQRQPNAPLNARALAFSLSSSVFTLEFPLKFVSKTYIKGSAS